VGEEQVRRRVKAHRDGSEDRRDRRRVERPNVHALRFWRRATLVEDETPAVGEKLRPRMSDGTRTLVHRRLVYLEDLLGRRVDVLTARGLKPRLRPLIDRDLVRVA